MHKNFIFQNFLMNINTFIKVVDMDSLCRIFIFLISILKSRLKKYVKDDIEHVKQFHFFYCGFRLWPINLVNVYKLLH